MGWSCASAAADTMDCWSAACRKQSGGSANSYVGTDGVNRFIETSRKEHDDGSITGTTWKYLAGGEHVRRNGSWRIDGSGLVSRYPAAWPFGKAA